MRISLDARSLEKQLFNIVDYSLGFIDGANKGKKIFLDNLGKNVIFVLGQYIDSQARSNRLALHHVYEWYQTGSPQARLFDLTYTVSNLGLSINSTFRQSQSVSRDGTEPFYNKAKIMESGTPVTITPRPGGALRFTDGGNEIFTKNPVVVRNPGGDEVVGSFEKTFDEFMMFYFTQAFLRASGILDYLKKPTIYKTNFAAGSKSGKSKGVSTGFKWITNAKIEVE